MASLSVSNAEGVLKVRYPAMKVKQLGYEGHPLLSLLPKDKDFTGKQLDIPLHFGGNQGASRTFATAQTNETVGLYEAFNLVRKKDYGLTSIELEAVQASMGDPGSFLRLATTEIDGIIRTVGQNLNTSLYRNFGGARGQVGSVSTVSLTLKNIYDVVNFEVGQKISSDDVDGTSGTVDAEAIAITAINRVTGVLTAAVTWTDSGNFSDDDYLFREGDFGNSIHGLDSWLPETAPDSTAFLGVNRAVDVTRLGGCRHDGSGQSIEDAIMDAEVLVVREGGRPTHVFMNPKDWGDLRKSMGARCTYEMANSPDVASIGFKSIVFNGSQNEMKCVSDRHCPQGVAYMLQMDTWKFYSLGEAPKILSGMGLEFLWKASSDAIEIRTGYYGNLGCSAPGKNCRVKLPTAA